MSVSRGNARRCRKCNSLAGKDGYCKHHRPEYPPIVMQRDNFIDGIRGFTAHEEREEFGIVKDEFGMNNKWGDR